MRFQLVPCAEAVGAILAHSLSAGTVLLKKGRRLSTADRDALAEAGTTEVMVALLEPSDVSEDAAAGRVARALAGEHVSVSEPVTGRANLFAAAAGLLRLDAGLVTELNRIDEGLTLATLAPFARVSARQMLATVKIIPFALPDQVVAAAERLLGQHRAGIAVAPFVPRTAGLVLTQLAGTKPGVIEKRRRAVADRLAACGSRLGISLVCEHTTAAIAGAVAELRTAGADPILIFGASAIVDRGDVVPAGLIASGGEVVHLGMPVDPGNLLMLGSLGGSRVIGVPSCAASPKENGFDWVLERCLAGLPLGRDDIIAMAPGGLLKEIASRPQPREAAPGSAERAEPRIAAVILAAGRSTRMGARNKLLEPIEGKPMVRRVAEVALASKARPVIAVTGHQGERVAGALEGLDLRLVSNPAFASGLASSLAAGIAALPADIDGLVVALGDMPGIEPRHIDRLIASFAPKEGRSICVPYFEGQRGNPVLWSARFRGELAQLSGDTGARHLISNHAEEVFEVEMDSPAVLVDVDTEEALARLRSDPTSTS